MSLRFEVRKIEKGIRDLYFYWLLDYIEPSDVEMVGEYRMLLRHLYSTPFRSKMLRDDNRASDGIYLRYLFGEGESLGLSQSEVASRIDIEDCSVLEMLIGLAIKMDETIYNSAYGCRISQWFWEMIDNLGLLYFEDTRFDRKQVIDILNRFMDRRYEPDGKGGLFRLGCERDLRQVEIWYQACWYMDEVS